MVVKLPMVLEAGYPNTTGFRKVVKATVLIKKKEGISDENFIKHYNNVHAQLAAPVLQRHKIISYSLVRFSVTTAIPAIPSLVLIERRRIISQETEQSCKTS